MRLRCLSVAVILWLASGASRAGNWSVVPDQSRLGFVATWEGTEFDGVFRRFDADLAFDPRQPEQGRFMVTVEVTSADANSSDLNEGMAAPEWFFFARYPQATFVTSAIRGLGGGRYEAEGTLTIKGVSRPLRLPFTWVETGGQARMQAEAKLRRTDFNVGEGEWANADAIGLDVRVSVQLVLAPTAPGG